MIREFVDRFEAGKQMIRDALALKHPESYCELVKLVVGQIAGGEYDTMDSDRIHEINDGHYQGTLVFVIGGKGYQPSRYWYVKVSYGSCSGCDTLQSIASYSSEPPTQEQIDDYMTLALHIVQGIKEMGDDEA